VPELSQFDLQFALVGARALSEDIQNKGRSIKHVNTQFPNQVSLLNRAESSIHQHQTATLFPNPSGDLLDLARTDQKLGIGSTPRRHQFTCHPDACRLGQTPEFLARFRIVLTIELRMQQ